MRTIETMQTNDGQVSKPCDGKVFVDLATAMPSYDRTHNFGTNAEADGMLNGFSLSDSVIAQAIRETPKPQRLKITAGTVSADFKAVIENAISSVPDHHRELVAKGGIDVFVIKDIAEYEHLTGKKFAGDAPEGYQTGWTWANVDCLFDATVDHIVLFESYTPYGKAAPVRSFDGLNMAGRFRHEFAHALDQAKGFALQNDPHVQKLYDDALKTLDHSPVTKAALRYYLPHTGTDKNVGLRETIAGLYSIMHGGGTDLPHVESSLKSVFSHVHDWMKKEGY